jgi:organic hydroperoxide reductase OsmC/OhrA
MAERDASVVHLDLREGYRFVVDMGGDQTLTMDEPPPLGEGAGPNASTVLGAAVGNCLSASLVYCLRRAHLEVESLETEVVVTPVRDERGRLRIGAIKVRLHPVVAGDSVGRVGRCLELFEDFCVVTESVRHGIAVDVAVDVAVDAATSSGAPTTSTAEGTLATDHDDGPSSQDE